ncbi:hypothetical protein CsatB_007936 [Cannabis sativa]
MVSLLELMVKRDSFISLAFSKVGFLQVMTYVHNIALGTAKGLAYLHNGCNHKIIQCDVKPDNILLETHTYNWKKSS